VLVGVVAALGQQLRVELHRQPGAPGPPAQVDPVDHHEEPGGQAEQGIGADRHGSSCRWSRCRWSRAVGAGQPSFFWSSRKPSCTNSRVSIATALPLASIEVTDHLVGIALRSSHSSTVVPAESISVIVTSAPYSWSNEVLFSQSRTFFESSA